MAQSIVEQLNTIERALGERMIEHALVIVRAWLTELGENNPYEEAFSSIQNQYKAIFHNWLSNDDEEADTRLDLLTGDTYQLVDSVYAELRMKRGLSPRMSGFNPQHPQSVMYYFAHCLTFKQEDYEWFLHVLDDPAQSGAALMAVGAMTKNIRECFNMEAFLTLIKGMKSTNEVMADQCMAYAFSLFIHYDIRIDFFPQIQNALVDTLNEIDTSNERPFMVLCALVRSLQPKWQKPMSDEERKEVIELLPDDVRNMISMLDAEKETTSVSTVLPQSEQEYMRNLVQMLPDTWLYSVLVADNKEREHNMEGVYLSIGRMDLAWENIDMAEKYLVKCLRMGESNPAMYINYGHCRMLKGDRIMAYENYSTARRLCSSSKEFFSLFRPDRRQLVDHGVPVEQIYFMEDLLLKGEA